MRYLILLRGINVGGKNKVPMADLRACLEEQGFKNVTTYIQSGNVILESNLPTEEVRNRIESTLPKCFTLDTEIIKVLVLTLEQLRSVVDSKPKGFGEERTKFHSDAIFLMGIDITEAMHVFNPREGVDKVWSGPGVVYSQRLSAMRTKSRLSKIMASPLYKSMTIRNWNTVIKLLELLDGTA